MARFTKAVEDIVDAINAGFVYGAPLLAEDAKAGNISSVFLHGVTDIYCPMFPHVALEGLPRLQGSGSRTMLRGR
jgi:hypothetical protein